MVFRSTGSTPYRVKASTAVQKPKPSQIANSTTSPIAGAAWPMLAMPTTSGAAG